MAGAPDGLHEPPPPTPAQPELVERAPAVVWSLLQSFGFWHADARVRHLEDALLVTEPLREYGERRVWRAALGLPRCLSSLFQWT